MLYDWRYVEGVLCNGSCVVRVLCDLMYVERVLCDRRCVERVFMMGSM